MTPLFNLLIDRIGNPKYIHSLTKIIAYFTKENINTTIIGGYSGFGSTDEYLEERMDDIVLSTLTDKNGEIYYGTGEHGHTISIITSDNCSEIVSLFDNKVEIVYGFCGDNSAKTKGYAAHSTYKLSTKENVTGIANTLLNQINNYILSGELKDAINTAYNNIVYEEKRKKQEEEDEYKRKRADHRLIYDKLVATSKNFKIPRIKKDAIVIINEDFAALSLARKMIDVSAHYYELDSSFVNALLHHFRNEDIRVWQLKHFHCEGLESKKHISIENGWKVNIIS